MKKLLDWIRPMRFEQPPMQKLEDRLGYIEPIPVEQVRESRRKFLTEVGALIVAGSAVFATCGLGVKFCGVERGSPYMDRDLPKEFDYHRHAETVNELRPLINQVSDEEGVPDYILEGMILACSDSNPYSPQQGLGGVVLLDPTEVGATRETLDRDPLLSLRLAARRYARIRRGASDDEEALARFFSSDLEVQEAYAESLRCEEREQRYIDYMSRNHAQMVKHRQMNTQGFIKLLEDRGDHQGAAEMRETNEYLFNYPNPNLDIVRDHRENQRCMYYVNNLDEWASEAVKLVLYVHPEYSRRYWRDQEYRADE